MQRVNDTKTPPEVANPGGGFYGKRWNDGTMERWNDGTIERWNEGTMERRNDRTMEQWNEGVSVGECTGII